MVLESILTSVGVTKSPTATSSRSQGAVAQLDDTGRGMSGNIRHPKGCLWKNNNNCLPHGFSNLPTALLLTCRTAATATNMLSCQPKPVHKAQCVSAFCIKNLHFYLIPKHKIQPRTHYFVTSRVVCSSLLFLQKNLVPLGTEILHVMPDGADLKCIIILMHRNLT